MPGVSSKNIAWFAEKRIRTNHKTELQENPDFIKDLVNLSTQKQAFEDKWGCGDIYRNYLSREILINEKLTKVTGQTHITSYIENKREYDCVCDNLIYEIKTGKSKRTFSATYQFDKQNDPFKRIEMRQINGYIFASFYSDISFFIIKVITDSGVKKINNIIKEKQRDFLQKSEIKKASGKRIRDTINVTTREIIKVLNNADMLIIDENDTIISKADLLNRN